MSRKPIVMDCKNPRLIFNFMKNPSKLKIKYKNIILINVGEKIQSIDTKQIATWSIRIITFIDVFVLIMFLNKHLINNI